jgi:phosphoribosylformylglycinamidine synthase
MAPKIAQVLILIGEPSEHLGQSALLDEVLNLAAGAAPKVDLEKELVAGQLIQNLNQRQLLQSAHDLSDGGLAIAAAEMALMGQVGIKLDEERSLGWLFGEGQGRYLVSSWLDDQLKILDAAKKICVPAIKVGFVEGKNFKIGNNSIEITKLNSFYESGLNSIFD